MLISNQETSTIFSILWATSNFLFLGGYVPWSGKNIMGLAMIFQTSVNV